MKRLLTLLALAALGAAACGDDSSGDKPAQPTADASVPTGTGTGKPDAAAPVSRGVQITNLAAACTSDATCTGAGKLTCLKDLGMLGGEIPGGYCTAECKVDDECGPGGSCPIGNLSRNPQITALTSGFGIDITTIIASDCFLKCDKAAATPCARSDQKCQSIIETMNAAGGGGGANPLAGIIGNFPEAKQTYCFPPIILPDAGTPPTTIKNDAGVSKTAEVKGIDAGL